MKNSVCKKKKKLSYIRFICWIIIPLFIMAALILDGLKIYIFNTNRLIALGACIVVILIPFFKEITFKNISLKK